MSRIRRAVAAGTLVALAVLGPVGFAPFGAVTPAGATVVATCSRANATIAASAEHTTYLAGTPVRFSVALHNRSTTSCSYASGPTSPTVGVTNASGVTVWGSCWSAGAPSPCADFLVRRTLAAGATSILHFSWDQRRGTPDRLVRAGRYRFAVSLQGLTASVAFALVRGRTIAVGVSDNARHLIVQVGDRVVVRLPTTGLWRWGRIATSAPSVLAIRGVGAPPGVTALRALHVGVATITATANPTCYPQCLMASRLLAVTVTVRA